MGVLLIVLLVIVALVVVSGLLVGFALNLLWFVLGGLVIGALARLVLPGRQDIGLLGTAGGGIAGSLLGGVIADAADLGWLLQLVVAIGVAAALVAVLSARGHDVAPTGAAAGVPARRGR
jgi:uncharacterized membrane protein YeaQ/YmgE (transglycosylase-associated protein family)